MATVEVLATEVVIPARETPGGAIWLSNLDLAARRGYVPTVYFFRPDGNPARFFTASALKDSLSRALVPFYPLAGRLGPDDAGRVQINCTGEGAVLVTARCDHYTLEELMNEFVPCEEMRHLLVPPENEACVVLLMAQATRLRCGGVVLGLALHHYVVDARSAAHFVETWANISRASCIGAGGNAAPCFDHTLLAARPASTPTVLYDHPEYKQKAAAAGASSRGGTYASAIIPVTRHEVSALKERCAGASTFRSVVALVWQCACRARALPPDEETRLYSMIDMRARLQPPLPRGYFGNAVIRTSTVSTVGEVVSNPIGYAARKVREATRQGDDYVRSLVDYLEGVDVMNLPKGGISPAHLRVISWLGMSLADADFGSGEPAFMGPALMYYSGFVYIMNAPGKDGAIMLAVSLEPEIMPEFKKVLANELARLLQDQDHPSSAPN